MPDAAADPGAPPVRPTGPLADVRVVELAGIGPAPFACMLLADLGADVVRVDRVGPGGIGAPTGLPSDVLQRGRRAVAVDLKQDEGRALVLRLVADADVLVEGFRPGVTERMGLGPHECLAANPSLVYGRMTGWGQDGPLARTAGHDIDYVAVTGALGAIGTAGGPPVVPVNLLGDFGGGSTYLVMGVLAALVAVRSGGPGQVVDAAIVDGVASLSGFVHGLRGAGAWPGSRGENLLDGGAPFYAVYRCAGGGFVAVGALEPQFYAELVRLSGIEVTPEVDPAHRLDPARWPTAREQWAALFATRTRDEWVRVFEGSDACVAPVLDWDEAAAHPHLAARGTLVERDGQVQPAAAPRFSATPAAVGRAPVGSGADTDAVLAELGLGPDEVARLRAQGVVG